jgi:micrococcal nuclease
MTAYLAPFTYNATVLRVVDGDTIEVDVDFGFYHHQTPTPVRLLGCNAWEKNTEAGAAAKANLEELLPPGTPVVLHTAKPDKYAPRWDADVQSNVVYGGGKLTASISQWLISTGWAAPWDGKGTAPLPPWPRTVAA